VAVFGATGFTGGLIAHRSGVPLARRHGFGVAPAAVLFEAAAECSINIVSRWQGALLGSLMRRTSGDNLDAALRPML